MIRNVIGLRDLAEAGFEFLLAGASFLRAGANLMRETVPVMREARRAGKRERKAAKRARKSRLAPNPPPGNSNAPSDAFDRDVQSILDGSKDFDAMIKVHGGVPPVHDPRPQPPSPEG